MPSYISLDTRPISRGGGQGAFLTFGGNWAKSIAMSHQFGGNWPKTKAVPPQLKISTYGPTAHLMTFLSSFPKINYHIYK